MLHHSAMGVYYVRSNPVIISYDNVTIEIGNDFALPGITWVEELDNQVFRELGGYSGIRIFDDEDSLWTSHTELYRLRYEAPEVPEVLYPFASDDTPGVDSPFDVGEHKFDYMRIQIALVDGLTASQAQTIASRLNADIELFFPSFSITGSNDSTAPTGDVTSLPLTSGNPFEEVGHYGEVDWNYNDSTNTFSAWIEYFGSYELELSGLTFTDDFLAEAEDIAYYYTDEDENRYLVFYYEEDADFMLTDVDVFAKQWTGFALWNLTSGEVVLTNRAWIMTYLSLDDDRDIYAYFYMPNIPYDELLSVSLSMFYRYGVKNVSTFFQQQYEEWTGTSMILEAGETTLSAYPTWVKDVWTYSVASIAVGAILTMVPGAQPIGIGLALAGGVALNLANIGALAHLISGGIDQMVTVSSPSSTLKSTIESHYSEMSGEVVTIDPEVPLYRLYLGRYNKSGTNAVEICYDSDEQSCYEREEFKYTEVVWANEGEIYAITSPYIDSETTMDQAWYDSLPEADPTLIDQASGWIKIVAIPAFTIIWALIAFKGGGFNVLWKFIAFAVGYVGILLALLLVLS